MYATSTIRNSCNRRNDNGGGKLTCTPDWYFLPRLPDSDMETAINGCENNLFGEETTKKTSIGLLQVRNGDQFVQATFNKRAADIKLLMNNR